MDTVELNSSPKSNIQNLKSKINSADHRGVWRLLQDGAGTAAWNMALDEALLLRVVEGASPPIMRLYQWDRPSISIGRFQNLTRTLDAERCAQLEIPIVRRLTGGRGILHGDDLTLCIAAPLAALGLESDARFSAVRIYDRIAVALLAAFERLGIEAAMGSCTLQRGQDKRGNCFDIVSRADIIEASSGQKLLGSALYQHENSVLQQTSIPLRTPERAACLDRMAATVFQGVEQGVDPSSSESIGPIVGSNLVDALIMEFEEALNVNLVRGSISQGERAAARRLMSLRYGNNAWKRGENVR